MKPTLRLTALALAACVIASESPAPAQGAPPPLPDTERSLPGTQRFPALRLEGVDEGGAYATVSTEPSPEARGLLLVRVQGGTWCGTCLWHAAHTAEALAGWRDRVHAIDLVLGGADAQPATIADAASFRSRLDDPSGVAVAPAPRGLLAPLLREGTFTLPVVVVVDPRTMGVVELMSNPSMPELRRAIEGALASAEGRAPRPIADEPLVDGLFQRNEWELVQAMALPEEMTSPVAALPAEAQLGKRLFFDAGLSASGKVACASCHDARRGLSDGRPQARGLGVGSRRTPRIALASFARHQMWDGRVDALDAQALLPLADAREMGATPESVARRVARAHGSAYRAAFPGEGTPDEVFRNVGRALAAYERSMRVREDALDAYARGDMHAMTFLQKQGLSMFLRLGCAQCHWGPRLTDDAFHVTRTGTGDAGGIADLGRGGAAIEAARGPGAVGAFKTPSLRGAAQGGPFGHGGAQATLSDVLVAYGNGGLPEEDPRAAGERDPWLPRMGETVQWSIGAFLSVLRSDPILP